MKYVNMMPEHNMETEHHLSIAANLEPFFADDVVLYSRSHDQSFEGSDSKFISMVTSAEGHKYIPPEKDHPNCLGVFMNYYPKTSESSQFSKKDFQQIKNVYPLQLGTMKTFTGDCKIPLSERSINVSFMGQYDPYRRAEFFHAINLNAEYIDDSVFHFYEGWNKGIPQKYSEVMSNTKIALVPCGSASLDTFRYYEAAKAGCVILCDIQNEYEFMSGNSHIEIDSWSNILTFINVLLEKPKKLEEISRKTRLFWEKNLSPLAASNFILSKIRENHEDCFIS